MGMVIQQSLMCHNQYETGGEGAVILQINGLT